jgi:glutathione peroxidase
MLKLSILLVAISTSIYSLTFVDSNGATVSFSQFNNKKLLIVNIATGSARVSQLAELNQLYMLHKDSLNIIAFPSNDFGNENRDNTQIKSFCQSTYEVNFTLASKCSVNGPGKVPVYDWLSSVSQNGIMNWTPTNDFQKVLIDKNGVIIGVFGSEISPLDSVLVSSITEQ